MESFLTIITAPSDARGLWQDFANYNERIAGYVLEIPKVDLDLESGLVAYYPFNGNANDESGNNYHGTLKGNAEIKNGYLDLTNGDGHVEFSTQLIPTNRKSYSVYLRVNPDKNSMNQISEIISQGSYDG